MKSSTAEGCVVLALLVLAAPDARGDWPMLGRDATRNPVSPEHGAPLFWRLEQREDGRVIQPAVNIRWTAPLGSSTCGDPVVARGLVWVGTNNTRIGGQETAADASVLACFRVRDGKLLYRYVSPRLGGGRVYDWPHASMASSPLIEGERLWFVTNRGETVCLDLGPLYRAEEEPRIVWKVDMVKQLGVFPRGNVMGVVRQCSVAGYRDYIYVITGNGVDEDEVTIPAPNAPSLVCLHKETGKVVWQDNSPGKNLLDGQWSSPLVIEVAGRGLVVAPQGDGWLRAFDALTGKLVWQFDMNRKEAVWQPGRGAKTTLLAAPVYYEGRIYLASGQHPAMGDCAGRLCCIDPTKEGDISAELAVDAELNPLPPRRVLAVDRRQGEKAIPNANSGLVWQVVGEARLSGQALHGLQQSVAIRNGLVIAADSADFIHCFDARTGAKHWSFDALAGQRGAPLIVDEKIYVGNEDGDMVILGLSAKPEQAMRLVGNSRLPLARIAMDDPISASPIFSDGMLFVACRSTMFAICLDTPAVAGTQQSGGYWPQYRGPKRTNVSSERGLLQHLPADGPPLLWKAEGLGTEIASVAVANGRIYTIGSHPAGEYAIALDEQTGERVWATYLGPRMQQMPLMRWLNQRTPTMDGERVYFMTPYGELHCLQAADGAPLWRKSYPQDFGSARMAFGFCDFPLVDGDRLICTPGGPKATVAALDKKTGAVLWATNAPGESRSSYGATVVGEIAGVRQYVVPLQQKLAGFAADNGRPLWQHTGAGRSVPYSYTPFLLEKNRILALNGYRWGVGLVELSRADGAFQVKEEYFQDLRVISIGECSVLIGDRLYVYPSPPSLLTCLDASSGKTLWQAPRTDGQGRPGFVWADDRLWVRYANGVMNMVEDNPKEYRELGSFKIPNPQETIGATTPVIAGGRLYLRDNNTLLCYDIRADALERPRPQSRVVTLKPPPGSLRAGDDRNRAPEAVFVPTPQDVVEKMLQMARVAKSDVVVDLGSGDGRIVITAAQQYGCKSVGYEIDPELVKLSREAVEKQKLQELVKIEKQDIFSVDLSGVDVVAVYLPSEMLARLLPQLQKLKAGARIVSHYFEIPGVQADEISTVISKEDGNQHRISLWKAPLKVVK